jgi:DNA mismatch repair protein MutL
MKAYEGFVQEGAVPAYFIFLDVDPGTVDVNISPTKSEVKFEDDSFIFQVLFASVREVLGKNSFAGSIDFSNPEANGMPVLGSHFSDYRPDTAPRVQLDEGYNPFEFEAAPATEGQAAGRQEPPAFGGKYVDRSMDYGKLFEDNSLPVSQTIVIGGRYIVTPAKDGLMVVDSRRARERILYDRALAALSRNMHVTQTAMFPVKVEVGVENRTLFDDKAALLSSLGFDISPFGTDTVVVNGVPEGFSAEPGKVQAMVGDLLLILSDDSSSLPGVMESSLAEKFALLGASSAAGVTSPAEARRIVDALLSCDNPEITAKGRKIMAVMPLSALEKLF